MKQETIDLFVPGRLCLFGEHSDWAGLQRTFNADIVPGAAIVTGVEQGIYATVEKCEYFIMENESSELSDKWVDFVCGMRNEELRGVAETNSYFSYAAGVASYVKDHYSVGGVKIVITKMTLPMKKGLSSSAAICVLVARAFNRLYNLNLNVRGEMNIAFRGELRTKSRCGRLDQACAFGVIPVCIRFDSDDIFVDRLSVKGNFYWVFADLNSKKDTIKILSDLNKCYPFAETDKEKQVHRALGELNQNIIERAIEYLKKGEAENLGKLMTEAQDVFDSMVAPASPEELAAPVLHSYLNDPAIAPLIYGGKGVGSQGDGSIQFLAKDAVSQEALCAILTQKGLFPYKLTLKPQRKIRKAIIPVAGYGTRLYPETRKIKKEMMPLLDSDGLVKPAILIILEQLLKAGIEEICLVVGDENDIHAYQDFFNKPVSEEHYSKLSPAMQRYEQKIQSIGKMICFRIQKLRRGFGHAVYQCRDFADGEPVLLLLGDTVYTSGRQESCTQQLIEVYETIEKPLIAIYKIPVETSCHYGVLSGEWLDNSHKQMEIKNFVEKPEPSYAERNLTVPGKNNERECYAVFGQYILPPEIFDVLQNNIDDKNENLSEIDMTGAFNKFIGKGLTGVVLDGEMYDIGNPAAYRKTFLSFSENVALV